MIKNDQTRKTLENEYCEAQKRTSEWKLKINRLQVTFDTETGSSELNSLNTL